MKAGNVVVLLVVLSALAVCGFGAWCEIRDRRRRDREQLGIGGRGVRR